MGVDSGVGQTSVENSDFSKFYVRDKLVSLNLANLEMDENSANDKISRSKGSTLYGLSHEDTVKEFNDNTDLSVSSLANSCGTERKLQDNKASGKFVRHTVTLPIVEAFYPKPNVETGEGSAKPSSANVSSDSPKDATADEVTNVSNSITTKLDNNVEKKEAVELLHSEAEKGNVLAIHDIGKVYADDKEKSDAYYKQALDGFLELEPMSMKLQPYLQYRIDKMYCYGSGTEQNYAESFGWFLKSAYAGNKFAQFSLANQYYYGNGFYKDKGQALHWYMKAAEQGLPYAAYAIAQMYANGEAVLQDEATAQRYYAQALAGFLKLEESDHADDNLLYKLGRMYRYGLGTDEDIPKALEYFLRSAKHGNINAKRMIAIEQLSGE